MGTGDVAVNVSLTQAVLVEPPHRFAARIETRNDLALHVDDLLSDFHPHGGVAQAYGVQRDDGISERAVFVVDKSGQVVFAKVYDIPTLPDNAEVRQAIRSLREAPGP